MMTLKGIFLPLLEWHIKHIFENYQPWKMYLSNGLQNENLIGIRRFGNTMLETMFDRKYLILSLLC